MIPSSTKANTVIKPVKPEIIMIRGIFLEIAMKGSRFDKAVISVANSLLLYRTKPKKIVPRHTNKLIAAWIIEKIP